MKWFGTFGQGQLLRDNFVTLEAGNYEAAAEQMRNCYGNLWASLYTEKAWHEGKCAAYYPKGEVALGEANAYAPGHSGRKKDEVAPPDQVVGGGQGLDNEFLVMRLAAGNQLLIHRGPVGPLTQHQAYCLASWLICKADEMNEDPSKSPFPEILEKIEALHAAS